MRRMLIAASMIALVTFTIVGCQKTSPTSEPSPPPIGPQATQPGPDETDGEITVLMVPKIKGTDYFAACHKGAKEAADELGNVELIFDGPTEDKVDAQIRLIEGYIAQNVDVIVVSPNDPASISPVLKKARQNSIHVLTFDADASAEKSGREFFVNQASEEAVAKALVDEMAAQAGDDANVAIVTASLTAANQNAWIREMREYMPKEYPQMNLVTDPKPSQEDQALAVKATEELMKTYPELEGIFAMSSVAFPGAADAVQRAGKSGQIAVVGLSTPQKMKQWVQSGTVETVILWNPIDLGYLTIYAARALHEGELTEDSEKLDAGRLGEVEIKGDNILLGPPTRFTEENIDQYNF